LEILVAVVLYESLSRNIKAREKKMITKYLLMLQIILQIDR